LKPELTFEPSNPLAEPSVASSDSRAGEGARSGGRAGAEEEERAWIERAQAGDAGAFRALVERYRDRAHGLALRILRSPADAEEVAQDAFVRVWRALPRFRGEAAFATWLFRIVARQAFDRAARLKGRRARESSLEQAPEATDPGRVEDSAGRQRALKLERLIDRLSDVQKTVVTLYYYQDRSVEEVASILALPENTVKTHLSRARAALRSAWSREGP
jgi:RNA polymerase sigma-70 factor (ECF subfamily)